MHHGARLSDGTPVSTSSFRKVMEEEMERVRAEVGPERFGAGRFQEASDLFASLSTSDTCPDFLTLQAYDLLTDISPSDRTPGGF
jgi:malate synthase